METRILIRGNNESPEVWQDLGDRKIDAIKKVRDISMVGLREAKELVELATSCPLTNFAVEGERGVAWVRVDQIYPPGSVVRDAVGRPCSSVVILSRYFPYREE